MGCGRCLYSIVDGRADGGTAEESKAKARSKICVHGGSRQAGQSSKAEWLPYETDGLTSQTDTMAPQSSLTG